MSRLLHIITKEENVTSVRNLIKVFEIMQKEAENDAIKEGYYPDKYFFRPNCDWLNVDLDGKEVTLKYKLEIFET